MGVWKGLLLAGAMLLLVGAVGTAPRYIEELVIGGGATDADGGSWFDKAGAARFTGAVQTGALTSTTGTFSGAVGMGALSATTGAFSGAVTVTGSITPDGGVVFNDDDELAMGTDSDFKWRFNAATSRLQLRDPSGNVMGYWSDGGSTGNLLVTGALTANGAFSPAGGSVVPDNTEVAYGTDSDFKWRFDTSTSRLQLRDAANNEMAYFTDDGTASSFHISGNTISGGTLLSLESNSSSVGTGAFVGMSPKHTGGGVQYVRMFRSSKTTAEGSGDTYFVIYSPGTNTEKFKVDAKTGAVTVTENITSSGDATFSGGDLVVGAAGTVRGGLQLRSATNAPGVIQIYSTNGTVRYLFVSNDGQLRAHTSLPTADTDGSIIAPNWAAPPALGATTANTIKGTTINATTEFQVNGTKVVGARGTAIADLSTSYTLQSSYDQGEIGGHLETISGKVNAIISALETHGLVTTTP